MTTFRNIKKALTQLELMEFEKLLNGKKLPESYRNHILKYNGGKPDKEFFEEKRIHHFYPIKYGEFKTLESTLSSLSNILPKDLLPFAYDGGGNQFCIALNKENYGKVYIWLHDMDDENDLEYLSNSFEEFIESLEE